MTELPATDYAEPVASLLSLGDTGGLNPKDWPDYPARFGLGPEHVPELIRMASEHGFHKTDFDGPLVWAPVHAWRTLGQLRTEEAIAPLLTLAHAIGNWQEAVREDVPLVLGMIGPAALGPVKAFLDDPDTSPEILSIGTDTLQQIAERHPACRDEAVGGLIRMLGRHASLDHTLNGFIIASLLDLKAVESIDAIRAAFAADTVDLSIAGDLEDAEVALGLRRQRATPRPRSLLGEWLDRVDGKAPSRERQEPRQVVKIGRNDPCPCGSGKKYKKCCMA